MSKFYLEFEKPVQELDNKIIELELSNDPNQSDINSIQKLKEKRFGLIEKIYSGLSRWQRVQLARHPNRPYSLDYINFFSPEFIELHGDRYFMEIKKSLLLDNKKGEIPKKTFTGILE